MFMYTKKRKGISPVIATVILIAVAVAIAIAVAFWAAGLTGIFTRFEKLEISSAYATAVNTVVINVRNTGSSDATITDIFLNGRPLAQATPIGTASGTVVGGGIVATITGATPLTVKTGESATITVITGGNMASGVTYDFKVHTASGNDYPKAVVIP